MTNEKHLKIAVLATVTDFGGAERVVLSLIEHINNDKFDLVPIIFTNPRSADNAFFNRLDRLGKKYYKVFVDSYKLKYLNPFVNILDAYKLLNKHKFDLIHTHGYRSDVIGIFLAKLMGLPVISTCHGFISNDLHLSLYNRLDRFILRFVHKIIAVSDGIKCELIGSGINESRIIVLQNAVNGSYSNESFARNRQAIRASCGIAENDFVVGYVGRLSEEKGVKYLIEAISTLNRYGTLLKLLIIGEGQQRKNLEDLVKKTNIEDSVIFAGFQNDIEKWLPAMDAFVLPSLTEGTPVSLLEAMAYGIPVIASSVGGVPDVVDSRRNGLLVSPGKPEEISNAIRLLYKDKNLGNNLSKEAQKTMKLKYNVGNWINKIETEYLKIPD